MRKKTRMHMQEWVQIISMRMPPPPTLLFIRNNTLPNFLLLNKKKKCQLQEGGPCYNDKFLFYSSTN